jgi:hypothetical protein
MRPYSVLRTYCVAAFVLGAAASLALAMLIHRHELTQNAAGVLTLCLNVILVMILPLVLDWSERKYFKARFVQLEELAQTNPQLKMMLEEQCQKLSLPGLRLAAVDMPAEHTLSYGLFRQNPRLVVPASWLQSSNSETNILPSIEVELNRFVKRDVSFVFLAFVAVQVALQYALVNFVLL